MSFQEKLRRNKVPESIISKVIAALEKIRIFDTEINIPFKVSGLTSPHDHVIISFQALQQDGMPHRLPRNQSKSIKASHATSAEGIGGQLFMKKLDAQPDIRVHSEILNKLETLLDFERIPKKWRSTIRSIDSIESALDGENSSEIISTIHESYLCWASVVVTASYIDCILEGKLQRDHAKDSLQIDRIRIIHEGIKLMLRVKYNTSDEVIPFDKLEQKIRNDYYLQENRVGFLGCEDKIERMKKFEDVEFETNTYLGLLFSHEKLTTRRKASARS